MITFTVTTLADSGTGSLRQAVADANACTGDEEIRIVFDSSLAGKTIVLESMLYVNRKMSITCSADAPVTLTGSSIVSTAKLELINMTLPQILLSGEHAALSGSGNKTTQQGAFLMLQEFAGDAGAALAVFDDSVFREGQYVSVNSIKEGADAVFSVPEDYAGKILYKVNDEFESYRSLWVSAGASLTLKPGVLFDISERGLYFSDAKKFSSEGAEIFSSYEYGYVSASSYEENSVFELKDTKISAASTYVYTGHAVIERCEIIADYLSLNNAAVSDCTITAEYCSLYGESGTFDGVVLNGDLDIYLWNSEPVLRHSTFNGAVLLYGGCMIEDCDLTNTTFDLEYLPSEAVVEFNGCTWGTDDIAQIFARFGQYAKMVSIDGQDISQFEDGLVVSNTNASGEGSLSRALALLTILEGDAEIHFAAELDGAVLTLDNKQLNLAKKLILVNDGTKNVTLEGLCITTSADLHIEGITLDSINMTHRRNLACSDVVLTGSAAVLTICDTTFDLSNFEASATQEGAYIYVTDTSVDADSSFAVIGEGLSDYRFSSSCNISSGRTLKVQKGASLSFLNATHDLSVYGKLVVEGTLNLPGASSGDRVNVRTQNGGTVILNAATVVGPDSTQNRDNEGNFHVYSGGTLTIVDSSLTGVDGIMIESGGVCTAENSELDTWIELRGTATLNDCTLTDNLKVSGTVSGTGNVFTGNGAVLTLSNTSADFSGFEANATQEGAYIGITGSSLSSASSTFRVLGEGLATYRIETAFYIYSGATLTLEEGVVLESPDYRNSMYVYGGGKLKATNATLNLTGHSNEQGSDLNELSIEGAAELTGCVINGYAATYCDGYELIMVRKNGKLSMTDCRLNDVNYFDVESGGTATISNTTLQNLSNAGTLVLENSTLSGALTLSGGSVSGSGNIFTGAGCVMILQSFSADLSGFAATATQEGAYVQVNNGSVNSSSSLRVLGEGLDTYRLNTSISVYDGNTFTLGEGVTLVADRSASHDINVNGGGKFIADGATLQLLGASSGDRVNVRAYNGAEVCLRNTVVQGAETTASKDSTGNFYVASGGRLEMENTHLEGVEGINVQNGATFAAENVSFNDTRLTIAATSSTCITGCDLSETSITISGTPGENGLINLSGNYWGTTDMDAIWAKITGDKSRVVIDDIALVDPLTEFVYSGTSLRNDEIAKDVTEFAVHLSHEIDEATVSENTVHLLDSKGTAVPVEILGVEGKEIRLKIGELSHGARFRLVLDDSICDINGNSLLLLNDKGDAVELQVDYVGPMVSRIEPGGDFAGTLEALKVYFSDSVDITTLKTGVSLQGPMGNAVCIEQVTDLGGNVYELRVAPQTDYGVYTLTVGTEVMDMAGNRMNQNGNEQLGESDDGFTGSFSIAEVDLTVSNVRVEGDLVLGGSVAISWSGSNASGYALQGSWTDGVYLSADTRWDIDDLLLGEYAHTGGLVQGGSYGGSISANLTGFMPGEYYILVRSDIKGQELVNKEAAEVVQNLASVPVSIDVAQLEVGTGVPLVGHLVKADSQDIVVLHQEAGQSLRLTLDCYEELAKLEIFIGAGRVPTRESYDIAWQKGTNKGEILIPGGDVACDLFLLVNNKASVLDVEYGLMAEVVPMSISSISPTVQGQNSATTFDISGVNFSHDTKVVLVDASGQEYVPDLLEVISSSRIRIKYDAKRLPAEKLDVVVRSGEEEVCRNDAITITASTGAHLKIASIMPNLLGYHIMSTLKLLYENTGTDAMHAPLLTFTGKQNDKAGAIMTMDSTIANDGFWTNAMPEGFSNSVSFLAYSPGTPGWLMPTGRDQAVADSFSDFTTSLDEWYWYTFKSTRKVMEGPGYQVSIVNDPEVLSREPESKYYYASARSRDASKAMMAMPNGMTVSEYLDSEKFLSNYLGNTAYIYYCGWQQPWDYSYPPFNFEIGYLGTDNTSSLNWYDSFSYTDMPEELKQALANSLTHSAGDTWGDYVLMLNQNLIYLDELGCVSAGANTMFDTDSLVEFELMKANGTMTPTRILASSTDMSVATTGLSLGISRVYMNNISSRFVDGDFGCGWSHNWDVKLSFREDGTVVYAAAGVQRVYQPSYQGGYINASGDHSSLVKNRDGSYTITERDGMVSKYDREGKLISLRDANGNAISCTYDEAGKLVKLTHSNGEYIAIEWGSDGHIAALTNKLGDTVSYEYEGGNLVSTQNSLGDKVLYSYSSEFSHALTQIVGADGASVQYTYNSSGLLEDSSATSDDGGISGYGKVSLSYGDNGEVTVTDFYGSTSTYYYDNKGLVRKAVDVNGNTIRYGYDDRGNMTWCTDQSGNTSSWTYDDYGNLTSATNALGHTTRYTYTAQNDIDILTDALGRATDYDYDASGNLTSIAYADGSMETWTYDAVGNADSWTNRRGKTVKSSHDAAGRVTLRQYEDGSIERFTYDERGNLLSAKDATGTTTYTYDERYRLTGIQLSSGHSLSYGYDSADRRVSMTDELGNKTCYAYDGFGNLTRVTDAGGKLIVEYSYDMGGRLTVEEKGDGTQTLYSYNKSGAVLEMNTLNAEGELVSFCHYEYDKVGMRTAMTTQDGCWRYTYDKIGQLTKAVFTPATGSSLATQVLEYEYDAAGNRTRSVVNGVETLYTINNMNQTTAAGDVSYTYDADGNMTSKTDSSGTTLYTWDDNNQLIRVQMATGEVYEYAYNAAGDRVSVTENGKVTQYVYDPSGYGNLVAEYDAASGQQEKTYTHGNGLIGFEDAMSGEYFWYQGDALGSVTGITDASGNLVATYSYDPFGSLLGSTGNIENPYQWTGLWGLSQESSGLTHMRARYYDAETGKFISADPIGVNGGVNLYAYCLNNGVMEVDPSGLWSVTIGGSAGATGVMGGAVSVGITFGTGGIGIVGSVSGVVGAVVDGGMNGFVQFDSSGSVHTGISTDTTMSFGASGVIGVEVGTHVKQNGKAEGLVITGVLGPKAELNLGKIEFSKSATFDFNDFDELKKWLEEQERQIAQTLDTGNTGNANSHDPNDMLGPIGYGEQNYIAPGMEMPFMIRFENEEKATAATHWMRVFTTFDEAYDLDSFTLDSFYVAGNLVELTAGQDSFNNKVSMTVDGKEVLVEVKINLDYETRELKAEFMAIDPETGFMIQDPELGMLYPNNESGRGDGYITYTISTKDDLATGTSIGNVADIYFDFNEVIPTPEVNYTIDSGAPETRMLSAVDQGHGGEVLLTWEGSDDGAGVAGYVIYVQKDGGEFNLWKSFDADTTTATFAGRRGCEYGFYVLGVDNASNMETKAEAEITATPTSTDLTAPDEVSNLVAISQGEHAIYLWNAVDDPSGVSYIVEIADNAAMEGAEQVSSNVPYLAVLNQEYGTWYWRVKAIDGELNEAEWVKGTPFIHTTADPAADDAPASALPLVLGSDAFGTAMNVAPVYNWVGSGDVQDYYAFTAVENGSYKVSIESADIESNLWLSVGTWENGEFDVMQRLRITPNASIYALDRINLQKGETYYVRVTAEDETEGTWYELSVAGDLQEEKSLITDNNTRESATRLEMTGTDDASIDGWVGAGDAVDFYRLEMTEAGKLSISLSELETNAKVKVYQVRGNERYTQKMSATASVSSGLDRTLSLTAGSYLIEIASYDNGAGRYNSTYALELEKEEDGDMSRYVIANA